MSLYLLSFVWIALWAVLAVLLGKAVQAVPLPVFVVVCAALAVVTWWYAEDDGDDRTP